MRNMVPTQAHTQGKQVDEVNPLPCRKLQNIEDKYDN
jgi:hypothetical protein